MSVDEEPRRRRQPPEGDRQGKRALDPKGKSVGRATARTAVPGSVSIDRKWGGRDDAMFHPAKLRVMETPPSPASRWVILTIVALFVAAFCWSYFGRFESNTNAAGKIQTAGRTKVLESIDTGQVVKINVRDGDTVTEGQALVELDQTDAAAARTIIDQKLIDLRAETLRLRTEIAAARGDPIDPKATIPWGPDVPDTVRQRETGVAISDLTKLASQIATLVSQKHATEAERDKYTRNIEAQKALVAVTQENMTMIDSLVNSGYNSQAKSLDMKAKLDGQQVDLTAFEGSLENAKQTILTIESQIVTTRETFVSTNTQTVSNNEQTIVDLTQKLVTADQTLANTILRAPVTGVVHASAITTIGQVIKPRAQLMQIVPRNAPLEIVAYVSNLDIGFIRKGDPAVIKVTTFVYSTYGSIDGTVIDIANDSLGLQGKPTLQDGSLDGEYAATSTAQKTGNIQFPVTIRAKRSTMTIDGKEVPLVPGMAVSVEIVTENRRAIDYVVSPILELLSTAGHEK